MEHKNHNHDEQNNVSEQLNLKRRNTKLREQILKSDSKINHRIRKKNQYSLYKCIASHLFWTGTCTLMKSGGIEII